MSSIKYRPEIDGIRAIAVISVIIYHLNENWLPGGLPVLLSQKFNRILFRLNNFILDELNEFILLLLQ